MKRGKARADHRADTRGGALSGLPHIVSDSPAYLSLSPFERAVLMEILRLFRGFNNGDIAITYQRIGERLRGTNASPPNNGRIARAIAILVDRGLIAEPTPASWLERRARRYRLTFITSGKSPPFKSATNDYLRWKPDRGKNDGYASSPQTPQSGDARSPAVIGAGDARSPSNFKNGSFASVESSSSGDAESLVICKPYPSPFSGEAESDRSSLESAGDSDFDGAGREAVFAIREKVAGHWRALTTSARRRTWAAANGLTLDELETYVIGDPTSLPFPKQAALVSAIRAEKAGGVSREARARQARPRPTEKSCISNSDFDQAQG